MGVWTLLNTSYFILIIQMQKVSVIALNACYLNIRIIPIKLEFFTSIK